MTELPDHRHSDDELSDLRRRNAFAVRPPVQQIVNLALPPILLIPIYLLCFVGVGLALGEWYIPGISCASLALVASLFIFWKKPRSRHHATIICIISLLVLVFGNVYYFKQFEQTPHDTQRFIGY